MTNIGSGKINLSPIRVDVKSGALFLMFLLLTFISRLPSFFLFNLSWDEGLYLVVAQKMLAGTPPYLVVWDHKPPGIFVLFALAQLLFGETVFAIRVFTCLAVTITCFLLYKLGALIANEEKVGILAGILYAAFSLNNEGLAANTEIFYAVFITLAFYFFSKFYPEKLPAPTEGKFLVISGIFLGIGLQINYLVILDLIAIMLIVGIDLCLRGGMGLRDMLMKLSKLYGWLLIGPFLILLIVYLYFMLKGLAEVYFSANFIANLNYVYKRDLVSADSIAAIRQQVSINAFAWVCLFLTPFYSLFLTNKLEQRDRKLVNAVFVWSAVIGLALVLLGRFYFHYFLHLLPSMCLLIAFLIYRIAFIDITAERRAQVLLLTLVLLAPLIQNIYPTLELATGLVYYRQTKGIKDWNNEPVGIAQYLRERIKPDDYIYSVDYNPIIYFLARAKIPTKYIFPPYLNDERTYELTNMDPVAELASIMNKRPVYIIIQYQNDNLFYETLERYLDRYYVREISVNGAILYRVRPEQY
jgi:4-amino-4-deoxy-L-arabinose transferase-like glycosyltransferase